MIPFIRNAPIGKFIETYRHISGYLELRDLEWGGPVNVYRVFVRLKSSQIIL